MSKSVYLYKPESALIDDDDYADWADPARNTDMHAVQVCDGADGPFLVTYDIDGNGYTSCALPDPEALRLAIALIQATPAPDLDYDCSEGPLHNAIHIVHDLHRAMMDLSAVDRQAVMEHLGSAIDEDEDRTALCLALIRSATRKTT